jgi:hypothetical protein
MKDLVKGYLEISEYPETPANDYPTRAECEGFLYISMVQLCNIAQSLGYPKNRAYRAFGGDKGKYPVIRDRQTRWVGGHARKKFVLISAVDRYFLELGIDW